MSLSQVGSCDTFPKAFYFLMRSVFQTKYLSILVSEINEMKINTREVLFRHISRLYEIMIQAGAELCQAQNKIW